MKKLIAPALLAVMSVNAHAHYKSGEDVYFECSKSSLACYGYLQAVSDSLDAYQITNNKIILNIPETTTTEQLRLAVMNWATLHPEQVSKGENGADFVWGAIFNVWGKK